jgi:hypothetical protein
LFKNFSPSVQTHDAPIVSRRLTKNLVGRDGERDLLTRSIDFIDPFALTIEEKIFRAAKRACIVFAIAALMLTALDLADIRSVENAADMIQNNRQRFVDLPNLIRKGI